MIFHSLWYFNKKGSKKNPEEIENETIKAEKLLEFEKINLNNIESKFNLDLIIKNKEFGFKFNKDNEVNFKEFVKFINKDVLEGNEENPHLMIEETRLLEIINQDGLKCLKGDIVDGKLQMWIFFIPL